jgi:3-hydroxyacyl-CoA dehydrogenase
MEHSTNGFAPEASTDERASPPPTSRFAGYEPVPLRHRSDGWTPARQVEFLEALADTGIVRKAAAMVGMSEQSVARLRRRPEASTFDLACEAARRMGARNRILATAYDRAIEGTLKGHYYRGELKSEERVYDNRLLTYLLGKVGHLLEPRPESLAAEGDWDEWMKAVAKGAPPPGEPAQEELPYTGTDLWEGKRGRTWTSYPPPAGFTGRQKGTWSDEDYCRTLSPEEERVIDSDGRRIRAFRLAQARAERDRYFRFPGNPESSSRQAEPSEPSAPSNDRDPPRHPLRRLEEAEPDIAAAIGGFTRRRGEEEGGAEEPAQPFPAEAAGENKKEGASRYGLPEPQPLRDSPFSSAPPREPNPLLHREAPPPVDVYVNPGLSEPEPSCAETVMSPITTRRHGDVLLIVSNNPPVNALGHAVREGLVKAIEQAEADEAVKAVVILCQGQTFFAGADISEFGTPKSFAPPILPQVVDVIENCSKPVVAAIHGTAFGGGLEVALASHYRVALPSAKLGVPEVKLGLLPGAGGTQRLPRVAGVPKALEMAATGNPISAKDAYEIGLVDRLIEGDLEQHAVAYAEEVRDVRPIPRSSARQDRIEGTDPSVFAEFRKANARKFRGFDAPEFNVRAIEAAVAKPYAEGVLTERQLFMELMSGTQAKAQQYFFFAERKASKIDGLPEDTQPRDIGRVGVIGAGTMGGGISMNFLSAGIPVTIVEMQQEALDRGTGVMRKNYEATAAKGRMSPGQVEQAMALLKPSLSLDSLADCDLIIEAVFENMDVKKEVFGKLDAIAKPGAILASNTSYLNIDEIAASTSRPEDVVGLHFFSPANVMKLLEVVRGAKTAPDVLVTAMQLAKKIRKVAVVAGVCYGFIGNRMLIPRQTQAMRLLLEGATPAQVDKVYTDFGMPMGPFQMADLAGVDIGWHRDPTRIENIRDALCAIDRWGQKKGAGFYDYDEKRRPSPSPKVEEIIDQFRQKEGVEKRDISDQEIVERTLYTMVNEGAKILEEGMAQRASDIDVVWVYGYGWPVYRGGPMFWADTEGLGKIVEALRGQQQRLGPDFSLSDLLVRKAEAGEKLAR